MLKLSKKTDYAIILLCHLGDVESAVSAQEIAGNYQLPQPMVANILKELGAAGLIQSVRGQHGGYVLARPAEAITLSDIISVTDNPFNLVECAHEEELCKVQCLSNQEASDGPASQHSKFHGRNDSEHDHQRILL